MTEEQFAALEARVAILEAARERPIHNPAPERERQNLLRIIGALAQICYGEQDAPYAIARMMLTDAAAKGLRFDLTVQTIGAKLNDAFPLVRRV